MQKDNKKFFSIAEVAEILELNERTIRRWLLAEKLSGHRLGRQWRISCQDLENFLLTNYHQAARRVL